MVLQTCLFSIIRAYSSARESARLSSSVKQNLIKTRIDIVYPDIKRRTSQLELILYSNSVILIYSYVQSCEQTNNFQKNSTLNTIFVFSKLVFLGVKTPLQIACVCLSVCSQFFYYCNILLLMMINEYYKLS